MSQATDSRAIVTGAASGIGRATALMLASQGQFVTALDLDERGAESLVHEIIAGGGSAEFTRVDVSEEGEVEAALDRLVEESRLPSVLVNCAGILHVAPAIETTSAAFDRMIRVNLRSVFLMSVGLASRLIDNRIAGSIVNVSSIHAVISEPNASAYTAAKGGIEAMARTFASEWASSGIRVNTVRPGATRTALTDALYTPAILAALAQRIPLKRPASPEEIAAGICFLASPAASYITGTTLDIDGGYIMDGSLPNAEYR